LADVFLSYARPDAGAAARLARELGKAGRTVWYDQDIPAHRTYAEVIERELIDAKAVVVLWSAASVDSQWVRSEANRARELGKLVQARLDDTRLPMPFDQIQCANLLNWKSGRSHLEQSVEALVAGDVVRPRRRLVRKAGRREVIAGGVAAAAAAAGGGWWLLDQRRSQPGLSPATLALMEQAKSALWQNAREGQNQAIAIYRQVVDQNPTFADAWGRLSIAYAWTSHWRQSSEADVLRSRGRSAAEQALSLDDRNPHAPVGLACASRYQGNWGKIIPGLRENAKKFPADPETAFSLGYLLSLVGQDREGAEYMKLALSAGPTPGVYVFYNRMLWSAGRQEELDKMLDEASKLYPTHLGIWFTRFYAAMLSGRPGEALALGADRTNWPTNVEPEEIEAVIRVAKAIESRSPAEVDAVSKEWMERARDGAGYAENSAQFLAALGRSDEAFAVLRAYFFSEGFDCGENRFSMSQGTFTARNDRLTYLLFLPPLASLRRDPRFAKLLKDLRFTDYWRGSGTRPDFLA
jgi:tetratricopeptide (TPR) repeat protein